MAMLADLGRLIIDGDRALAPRVFAATQRNLWRWRWQSLIAIIRCWRFFERGDAGGLRRCGERLQVVGLARLVVVGRGSRKGGDVTM
jgi:hypothetical protein